MRFLLLLAAALAAAAVSSPVFAASPQLAVSEMSGRVGLEREILRELNRVRAAHDLRPVRPVRGLRAAAAAHSRSMLELGFFDHASADGTTFDKRIRRYYPDRGWQSWSVGETLLATSEQLDARLMVAEWIESRSHRAIILSPTWHDVGVGAHYAAVAPNEFRGLPTTVVTADFGARVGRLSEARSVG